MELKIVRTIFTDKSTIGDLYINDGWQCVTLEDKVRDIKIAGCTAIPAGKYEIDINWSVRFKRYLPILLNVPNFAGVRIHAGNSDRDTEGCILVGMSRTKDWIGESVRAFNILFPKLLKAIRDGETVTIEIINKPILTPSVAPPPREATDGISRTKDE